MWIMIISPVHTQFACHSLSSIVRCNQSSFHYLIKKKIKVLNSRTPPENDYRPMIKRQIESKIKMIQCVNVCFKNMKFIYFIFFKFWYQIWENENDCTHGGVHFHTKKLQFCYFIFYFLVKRNYCKLLNTRNEKRIFVDHFNVEHLKMINEKKISQINSF